MLYSSCVLEGRRAHLVSDDIVLLLEISTRIRLTWSVAVNVLLTKAITSRALRIEEEADEFCDGSI